jgi:hypothetical protein
MTLNYYRNISGSWRLEDIKCCRVINRAAILRKAIKYTTYCENPSAGV